MGMGIAGLLQNYHEKPTISSTGEDGTMFARPTRAETAAVGVCLAFTIGLAMIDQQYNIGGFPDFRTYLQATGRQFAQDYPGFFYAHWILPLFSFLDLFPLYIAYFLWNCINVAGIWFAARVFGGNSVLALFSYQMLYLLYYGNITGLIVGSLALLWLALHRKWWIVGGAAWLIACTKPQLGIPISLVLMVWADCTWYLRLRMLAVALLLVLASLIAYPDWVSTLYETSQTIEVISFGSISLWPYIGAFSLLLWLPLARIRSLSLVVATTSLTMPYFQHIDLLMLFVLPVGWVIPVLGNLGFLFLIYSWSALKLLIIVPIVAYLWGLFAAVQKANKTKNPVKDRA